MIHVKYIFYFLFFCLLFIAHCGDLASSFCTPSGKLELWFYGTWFWRAPLSTISPYKTTGGISTRKRVIGYIYVRIWMNEKDHEKTWKWVRNTQPTMGLESTLYTIFIYIRGSHVWQWSHCWFRLCGFVFLSVLNVFAVQFGSLILWYFNIVNVIIHYYMTFWWIMMICCLERLHFLMSTQNDLKIIFMKITYLKCKERWVHNWYDTTKIVQGFTRAAQL